MKKQVAAPVKSGKLNKMDKLRRMQEKMAKVGKNDTSKGFWNPHDGLNTIRILPEAGGMEIFYQQVGVHRVNDKPVYCPYFTTDGERECPICDVVQTLYKQKNKELAGKLKFKKRYWMNVIDRENEEAGVLIYTAPVTVIQAIAGLVGDPEYGDITDIEDGIDITITRTGKDLETEYTVRAKRNNTPLSDDEDKAEAWLESAKDLSYVEVTEDPEEDQDLIGEHVLWFYPYDRIVSEYGIDPDEFEDDYQEDEEDDEDDELEEEAITPAPKKLSEKLQEKQRIVKRRTR